MDELDELDVVDPLSVLGDDVVADDSEELFAGGAGVGVAGGVVVVDSDRVVDSLRVSGDAEGATRSRSVTRSVLSVQPASTPAPSARTQTPVSHFFIIGTSVVDSNPARMGAMGVPPTRGLRYAERVVKAGHTWEEN